MVRLGFITIVLALSANALICGAAEKATGVPVLLELFTSEGCSSCPPADRLLQALDQNQPVPGAELIVLSEHVDYWDRLGWKDPFSSAQYTARQQDYTNKYRLDGVYTPQLVVDGRFGLVGSDERAASASIRTAIRETKIPIAISNVARDGNRVAAHIQFQAAGQSIKGGHGVLYIALADNRAESHVTRGENGGHNLAHVAVTRVLQQVATVDLGEGAFSKDVTLPVQPGSGANGMRFIAFLQDPRTGHVLGVAAQKL